MARVTHSQKTAPPHPLVQTAFQSLLEKEKALARGQTLILSPNDEKAESLAIAVNFLRAFRGRADFAQAVLTNQAKTDFSEKLEQARNLLYRGRSTEAQALLESLIRPANSTILQPHFLAEQSEIFLELSRALLFQGRLPEALTAINQALENPGLSEVSRMTSLQLRGDLLLRMSSPKEARLDLEKAIALSEIYHVASSGISAQAFLVKALLQLNELTAAQQALDTLRVSVHEIKPEELWLDRLLTLLRTEALFRQSQAEHKSWLITLCEAHAISLHLGDHVTQMRCEEEAGNAKILSEVAQSEPFPIHSLQGWKFLPQQELILLHSPKKIIRMGDRPVAQKILLTLLDPSVNRKVGIDKEQLFEKVWNLSYSSERHSPHLLATLSKVRKLLPAQALRVEEGKVRLV